MCFKTHLEASEICIDIKNTHLTQCIGNAHNCWPLLLANANVGSNVCDGGEFVCISQDLISFCRFLHCVFLFVFVFFFSFVISITHFHAVASQRGSTVPDSDTNVALSVTVFTAKWKSKQKSINSAIMVRPRSVYSAPGPKSTTLCDIQIIRWDAMRWMCGGGFVVFSSEYCPGRQ